MSKVYKTMHFEDAYSSVTAALTVATEVALQEVSEQSLAEWLSNGPNRSVTILLMDDGAVKGSDSVYAED